MNKDIHPTQARAFAKDILERKHTAEQMTKMISSMDEGKVIAVDAQWGDGKTFFGRNFAQMLKEEYNATPIFIDAFENDYVEDPFTLLASAIYAEIKEEPPLKEAADTFSRCAISIGKRLFPLGVEIAATALGYGLCVDQAKRTIEAVKSGVLEATESLLQERFESYREQQKEVEEFKKALGELAKTHRKRPTGQETIGSLPLIIFIDEMDRCRPTFAVQLLERIKHFFEVENVVFILLVNKKQIFEAIKGVYGPGIEAEHYFEKFIDCSFSLNGMRETWGKRASELYCEKWEAFLLKSQSDMDTRRRIGRGFYTLKQAAAVNEEISLRDIEKISGYICRPEDAFGVLPAEVVPFLAILKVKYPLDYIKFAERRLKEMTDALEKVFPGPPREPSGYNSLKLLIKKCCVEEFSQEEEDQARSLIGHSHFSYDSIFQIAMDVLDNRRQV